VVAILVTRLFANFLAKVVERGCRYVWGDGTCWAPSPSTGYPALAPSFSSSRRSASERKDFGKPGRSARAWGRRGSVYSKGATAGAFRPQAKATARILALIALRLASV
jgi:hypothetical protein